MRTTIVGAASLMAAATVTAYFVDPPVNLQASSPGTAQTGNINVTGKVIAGSFSAVNSAGTAIPVLGHGTSASGANYGGLFKSDSPSGRGVRGYNTAGGIGGDFQADGGTGNALRAIAAAASGNNIALFAKTNSASGLAGSFVGNVSVAGSLAATSFSGSGSGLTGVIPSGTAGGDLVGSYPNPTVASSAINNLKLASDRNSFNRVSGGFLTMDASGVVGPIKASSFQSFTGGTERASLGPIGGRGTLSLSDETGEFKVRAGTRTVATLSGFVFIMDAAGATQAGMNINASNQGEIFGDVKSFRKPNPRDLETDIWYASVEGPEAAAYLRGTGRLVDGRSTIAFPDHFQDVSVADGMTVQLTPRSGDTFGLWVAKSSLDGIEVRELKGGTGNFEFDWEVKAVRKGHESFRVIRPWDEGIDPAERKKAWDARMKSIRMSQPSPLQK